MQTLQDFLRWASNLPPFAKGLFTLILIIVCGFLIVVMWTKPAIDSGKKGDGTAVNATAGSNNSDSLSMWPSSRSMDGLKRRLDRISKENARFLVEVASADQFGLYPTDVESRLNMSRAEVIARSEELKSDGLIDCLKLTDTNFRLNEDVQVLLRPNPLNFLSSYFNIKPVGKSREQNKS